MDVRGDGSVELIVPSGTSRATARAFLASRQSWIHRTRLRLLRDAAPAWQAAWDGSGTILLRGRQVLLRRVDSRVDRPRVRVTTSAVEVFAPPHADSPQLERALRAALRKLARQDASRALTREAAQMGLSWRGPRIGDQRSRWGSCASSGLVSLNWRLVLAPPEVLRYVVIHELCHRVHADHSRRFWTLVASRDPRWSANRQWLKRHAATLQSILPPT
ncbi:MAG TPA: SprT family zinc-dependent metalloprotease [Nevskiaceae bacterium]